MLNSVRFHNILIPEWRQSSYFRKKKTDSNKSKEKYSLRKRQKSRFQEIVFDQLSKIRTLLQQTLRHIFPNSIDAIINIRWTQKGI